MEVKVILIDENDNETGEMEKIQAHRLGVLHRAFSVFIFNKKAEILLQKRALIKYHSGGLWTNTCCGHPMPGENIIDAGRRRLKEEMGINCSLKDVFQFQYKVDLDHDMVENEFDHVLFGKSDEVPILNKQEADDFRYVSMSEIKNELKNNSKQYTEWFRLCFEKVYEVVRKEFSI